MKIDPKDRIAGFPVLSVRALLRNILRFPGDPVLTLGQVLCFLGAGPKRGKQLVRELQSLGLIEPKDGDGAGG